MAKYDWKQLEKEYILGNYKTVSTFLKDHNIPNNGNTKKTTKGWKDKKVLKEEQKSTKVIEKVLEKQAEKEAKQIINIKDLANKLVSKIQEASDELDRHLSTNKKRVEEIEYDIGIQKPISKTVYEKTEIAEYKSIIDRKGLKELTSALKDLNDIIAPKEEEENNDNSFVEALKGKTETVWDEEE